MDKLEVQRDFFKVFLSIPNEPDSARMPFYEERISARLEWPARKYCSSPTFVVWSNWMTSWVKIAGREQEMQ